MKIKETHDRIPFHSLTLFTQSSALSNFFISDVTRARRIFLFLVLPFVFISSSRGTLTATCRVCGHVFLSYTPLSSLPCFSTSYIQYLEDTMRLTLVLEGATPERRERRVLKKSFSLARCATRQCGVRVTARVSHVAPIMIILYFSPFSFSRLAFIIYASAPSSIFLCSFSYFIFSQDAFLLNCKQKFYLNF